MTQQERCRVRAGLVEVLVTGLDEKREGLGLADQFAGHDRDGAEFTERTGRA